MKVAFSNVLRMDMLVFGVDMNKNLLMTTLIWRVKCSLAVPLGYGAASVVMREL